MGSLCSRNDPSSPTNPPPHPSKSPFANPGRTLSSAPPPSHQPRSSSGNKNSAKIPSAAGGGEAGEGGRVLEGGGGGGGGGRSGSNSDARAAAARAAEERAARANQHKGKLGRELAREKVRGVGDVSAEERRRREVEAGVGARDWD
ncbi:hypothetical protein MMC12_000244 [Toensbergia leucococca]|nr:hypothetical protein [Toensbergia leucococca]